MNPLSRNPGSAPEMRNLSLNYALLSGGLPLFLFQVNDLRTKVQHFEESSVDKTVVQRLENKIRDLESRLDLETTTKHRLEVSIFCNLFNPLYTNGFFLRVGYNKLGMGLCMNQGVTCYNFQSKLYFFLCRFQNCISFSVDSK